VGNVVILSAVAGLGVLLAAVAIAMPASRAEPVVGAWSSIAPNATIRDRINQPFQALAEQSSRRRRLNGGLTLAEHLARADLKLRTSELVMIQVAFLIVGLLLGLWRFGFAPQFVIAAVGAYLLPMRFVKFRQRRRLKAFNGRLPDTMSLLSNALKAGLSLPPALEVVARNATAPVADELNRAIREMNLGTATPQAMANMVRRVGSEDLDLVVTAISIHSTVGGNLARILDSISHTIRQRVQMKAQISAMTAQMRASGWIITLLPFIVAGVLNVITPSYFQVMFTTPLGRVMLGLVLVSVVIGNFFIRRITTFRV
jgi:tight adherence protein B